MNPARKSAAGGRRVICNYLNRARARIAAKFSYPLHEFTVEHV